MRILVTLRSLGNMGGVQSYSTTLANALQECGHEVALFPLRLFAPVSTLRREGLRVLTSRAGIASYVPDVIHAQHRQTALLARAILPATPMIFHAHGVIPSDEQPPSVDLGIAQWVAVSPEVAANLRREVKIRPVSILYNPIDIYHFRPESSLSERPERAVVFGRDLRSGDLAKLSRACGFLGIELTPVGTCGYPGARNMRKVLNGADIVFGLGRTVIEAMGCGRAVYVFGQFGADGWVRSDTIDELARANFSGRRYRTQLSARELAKDIEMGYSAAMGPQNREIAVARYSLGEYLPRILQIYSDAMATPELTAAALPEPEIGLLFERLDDTLRIETILTWLRYVGGLSVLRRMSGKIRGLSRPAS